MRNFFKPNKKLNHRDRRARRGKNGPNTQGLGCKGESGGYRERKILSQKIRTKLSCLARLQRNQRILLGHGWTRIISEEKNRNGKIVLPLSKPLVHKADSYSPAIPEIPPSPPFSKGGLGGISETRFPPKYA
jgi:hypothetical protein